MGLDMYLSGNRFFFNSGKNPLVDGFQKKSDTLDIGYWRKHPDLHGYIVENFAGGVDECQEIDLSKDGLSKIIKAIENDQLSETSGFFFGASPKQNLDGTDDGIYLKQKEEDIQVLTSAITWLDTTDEGIWKSVVYRASW